MDTTNITSSSSNAGLSGAAQSSDNSLTLNSKEFMEIMITELTNQDPFEPMKNQDLLNQMATIQQLQSNQDMAKSFENMMDRYDSLLLRQELNTAAALIGQLISGASSDGSYAMGRVTSVSMDGSDILLEIDTGQRINIQDMERLGGKNSQDIIGQMVIGVDTTGMRVVGKVNEVEVSEEEVLLHLQVAGQDENLLKVPLRNASIVNHDTADLLMGYQAVDINGNAGVVESVKWIARDDSTGVILNILNEDGLHEVPLEDITSIF